jgi:starch-binding outer membrane protein, SusD/RagB family
MKKIYVLFCLGLLFLTACEKLVEVDAPASQLGTSQVFEDVQTANAAMAGLYAGLRDQSLASGAGYYTMGTLLGSYTDDLDCYYNNTQAVMDIYLNQQDETNTIIKSIWKTAYQQVYYANSIIFGVENSSSLSVNDKKRIKGEAILVRSLIYFYLQQIFGDIPYTTSIDYEYNRNISKTDAATVLEKLEADLTEAAGLLQDDYRNSERIYPNRKTAQLLLARIYLLRSEWLQAEKMADTVLLSPLYQFQTDINEVFHKFGKHILWQLMPENSGDATEEALFYYFSDATPNNVYTLSQDLVNIFTVGDLRKQVWMAEINYDGNTWYRPYKYKNLSGTNYNEYSVVFRLEEAYFIKAEALARQNFFDEALPYLNATRERAGLPAFTSLTDDDFITELLAEKRREFFCESGHRFLDLKRLGRLNDLSALKPNWEEYKHVWPLPQDEMLLDQNLSPQNTGY